MSFSAPALINDRHQVQDFDCGRESLNRYLKRFALTNTAAGTARTFVTTETNNGVVIGCYSLAAASVEKAAVTERIGKGISNHPVPVILLARLAVHINYQGRGLGKGLLRDALQRALTAADIIGVRAILVHAKDAEAAAFYRKFGFVASPSDALHLMLLIKDIRHTLGL